MKRIHTLISALLVVFMLSGGLMANGLSLNSIGTRALAMGGAFVGLSDDLTAIYWNPAGLTQMQGINFEIFGSDIIPIGTYQWKNPAFGMNTDATMKSNHYISPNLFASYGMGDLTLGLGLYVPAGLGAEWDGSELLQLSNGVPLEWMSKIAAINISPSIAYKASDALSVGMAVNVYYGMFDMKRPANVDALLTSFQYDESSTGIGYGVTLGALIKLHENVNLGLTYRTKSTIAMSGTAKNAFIPIASQGTAPEETDFDRDVSWPMWLAAGLALKPAENLTVTIDAQFSQWSESSKEFKTEYKDPFWAAATGATGDDTFELHWKDATQIRFGVEYWLAPHFALRGGYYNDPAPAPDETLIFLFPSSSNEVATLGLGYKSDTFFVNVAFEYLFGADRVISDEFKDPITDPTDPFKNAQPGTHHLDVFAFSLGFGMAL